MVANLIFKSGNYYCSNCMMRQSGNPPRCFFCSALFSNWESAVIEAVDETLEEEDEYLKLFKKIYKKEMKE